MIAEVSIQKLLCSSSINIYDRSLLKEKGIEFTESISVSLERKEVVLFCYYDIFYVEMSFR